MTQVLFTIVALLCLYLFVRAIRIWQVTLLWLGWAIVVSAAAITGLFQLYPITFAPVLLATFICCVFTWRLIQNCQLAIKMLYAIHILRIVVELVLFKLYSAGKVL